jgi:hypothetical protein
MVSAGGAWQWFHGVFQQIATQLADVALHAVQFGPAGEG